MTPEEITTLAVEYVEEIYPHEEFEDIGQMDFLRNTAKKNVASFIRWLLRTHCIVEKSKVQGLYRHYKSHCDKDTDFEFGNGAVYVLDDLFDSQLGKEAAL